jgi:hypothetical protein
MATTSSPSPMPLRESTEAWPAGAGVDHQSVGGFCACCGAVHPCAAARRQARDQPSARESLVPMSRLARLRNENTAPMR